MSIKDKVALITGSTSGIGLGIAESLAAQGCHIMLNGFGDPDEIKALQQRIEADHTVKVSYSDADLSRADDAVGLVKYTEEQLGAVDILVNNAGIQHVSPVEEFPHDKWEQIIAINLSAAFYTIHEAMKGMKQRKFGRIINIASAHGLVASANKAGYVAAKHGLVGLTKVVALETATQNITCNAICPGWVLTPLVQKQVDAWAARDGISVADAEKALLSEKQPSLRFTAPEEVGEMAVYLCSDAARNVTGTTLSIDGGWTAQ